MTKRRKRILIAGAVGIGAALVLRGWYETQVAMARKRTGEADF